MSAAPVRQESAPTLLVGVGSVGLRIAKFLGERLGNSLLVETGMLEVIDGSDPSAIPKALEQLTRQRHVLPAETKIDVRIPSERYLRLQLILVANAAELAQGQNEEHFRQCAEAFVAHPHPFLGLRVCIALDASSAERLDAVAPNLEEVTQAVEALLAPAVQPAHKPTSCLVFAHRFLLDGTHLLHPNLSDAESETPDEFESVVSMLLESILRHGSDAIWKGRESGLRYLFLGGGSSVFPRELLLSSVSQRLGADLITRIHNPTPGSQPIDLLPTRSDLFERAITKPLDVGASLEQRKPAVQKISWYQRIFGHSPALVTRPGIGIRVPSMLGRLSSASAIEVAEWYEADEKQLLADLETKLLPALERVGLELTAWALDRARKKVDELVQSDLGGGWISRFGRWSCPKAIC